MNCKYINWRPTYALVNSPGPWSVVECDDRVDASDKGSTRVLRVLVARHELDIIKDVSWDVNVRLCGGWSALQGIIKHLEVHDAVSGGHDTLCNQCKYVSILATALTIHRQIHNITLVGDQPITEMEMQGLGNNSRLRIQDRLCHII